MKKDRNAIFWDQLDVAHRQSELRRYRADAAQKFRDRKREREGSVLLKRSRASKATRRGEL